MRKRKNHGGAVVEFFLILPFLTSLILGTLIYGSQLVKELQVQQIARDVGSMSARGTSFMAPANAANQDIVSRLGTGLNWPSTGGLLATSPGVVYVSVIEYLDSTCNGSPGCSNASNWVFVKSVAFGNTNLRHSNFGAPAPCTPGCYDNKQTDGSLTSNDTMNTAGARVNNFTYLGTPSTAAVGFQPGQYAYLVEVAATTSPFNGGSIGYAFSLF